ncbi:hypothetical protein WJX79_008698 [Trebouxia sp. C0005]
MASLDPAQTNGVSQTARWPRRSASEPFRSFSTSHRGLRPNMLHRMNLDYSNSAMCSPSNGSQTAHQVHRELRYALSDKPRLLDQRYIYAYMQPWQRRPGCILDRGQRGPSTYKGRRFVQMQTSSCCQSLHKGRGLCLASLKKKCAHGNTSFPVQDILENCTRCLLSATREQGQANIAGLGQVFNPHQAAFKQADSRLGTMTAGVKRACFSLVLIFSCS